MLLLLRACFEVRKCKNPLRGMRPWSHLLQEEMRKFIPSVFLKSQNLTWDLNDLNVDMMSVLMVLDETCVYQPLPPASCLRTQSLQVTGEIAEAWGDPQNRNPEAGGRGAGWWRGGRGWQRDGSPGQSGRGRHPDHWWGEVGGLLQLFKMNLFYLHARDVLSPPSTNIATLSSQLDSGSPAGQRTKSSQRPGPHIWAWLHYNLRKLPERDLHKALVQRRFEQHG